jgi:hypothetical protein
VVSISSKIVNIDLLFDDDLWVAHLGDKIESNILESKEACKIERSSSNFISFDEQLKDVILTID